MSKREITAQELEEERLAIRAKFHEAVHEGYKGMSGAKEIREEFLKYIDGEFEKAKTIRAEIEGDTTLSDEERAARNKSVDVLEQALASLKSSMCVEEVIEGFRERIGNGIIDLTKFDEPKTLFDSNKKYKGIIELICCKTMNPSYVDDKGEVARIDTRNYGSEMACMNAYGLHMGSRMTPEKKEMANLIHASYASTLEYQKMYDKILELSIVNNISEKNIPESETFPLRYIKQIIIEKLVEAFDAIEDESDRVRFATNFVLGTCKSFKDEWSKVIDCILEVYKDQLATKVNIKM